VRVGWSSDRASFMNNQTLQN